MERGSNARVVAGTAWLLCATAWAGIYSGPTDTATYNALMGQVQAKAVALSNKVAQAQVAGVNTDYAQVTQVTLELFKNQFTPWDRGNPASIDSAYAEKGSFATDDPVYAAYGAAGLPFDELADCIEIADAAIAELDQQIAGSIVLLAPPDFSTGFLTLSGTHYELDGRKVVPSRFFWQPENDEGVWQAFGRMGAAYYGLRPHMAQTNLASASQLNNFLGDVNNLKNVGAAPVEFWHATVVSSTPGHWLPDDYPDVLVDGRRYFNHYDIDNPLVRQWESNLFSQVLGPAVASLDAVGGPRYHLLNNEPRFPIRQGNSDSANNLSAHTYAKFAAWLQNVYTNIASLNAAYGTGYPDFATASTANYVVDDGVSESLQGGPIWYDWCAFNMERVNGWLTFLHDLAHSVDATPSTYVKIWGEGSIHTAWQDQGIDYEYLAKMLDIPGSDSQCTPFGAAYDIRVEQDWRNRYAFEWRAQAVMMDFIKSMSPGKPYLDAEWHGFTGNRWRDFHMDERYVRAILWMAASQGLSGMNAWFWNRNQGDASIRSMSEFAGSPVVQPIVLDAYGRTMKEINAHAATFASFLPAERCYVVYYSKDSALQDDTYSDNMTDVYEALKLLNVPVGFTTPAELSAVSNATQTLVVPRTEFISDADLAGLQAFEAGGGKLLLVDPSSCFLRTERGVARSGGSGLSPIATVAHGEIYAMAAALEAALASRKPVLPVDCAVATTNGVPHYGVVCYQHEEASSGDVSLCLINLSQDPRSVVLAASHMDSIDDLVTGGLVPSTFVMDSQDVLLLRIRRSLPANPVWSNFVVQYGLTGVRTDNADADSLDDWGEYVFGGDPTNPAVAGILPVFDPATGDFTFQVRNDPLLAAFVLTRTNLLVGAWDTNQAIAIVENDGAMGEHLAALGLSDPKLFWTVKVEEVNQPPAFAVDPILKSAAVVDVAYTGSIAGEASDPESDPLTFSKLSGPAWLAVASSGALGGTPGAGDLGTNDFVVQVVSSGGSDTATLRIIVGSPPLVVLASDDFEGGNLGNWLDAGSDSRWLANATWSIGTACAHIRSASSSSNIELANPLDLSSKTRLLVDFSYICNGMEAGEDFWVQFSSNGGASWTTVAAYVAGTDFANGTRQDPQVVLDSGSYAFTSNVKIRFNCDASDATDNVYLDNIVLSAQ